MTKSAPDHEDHEADIDAARADGEQEGRETGMTEVRAAERERCKGILDCPESDLRSGLARHLAFKTDLLVEECREILRNAPVDPAKAADISAFFRAHSPTFMNEAIQ